MIRETKEAAYVRQRKAHFHAGIGGCTYDGPLPDPLPDQGETPPPSNANWLVGSYFQTRSRSIGVAVCGAAGDTMRRHFQENPYRRRRVYWRAFADRAKAEAGMIELASQFGAVKIWPAKPSLAKALLHEAYLKSWLWSVDRCEHPQPNGDTPNPLAIECCDIGKAFRRQPTAYDRWLVECQQRARQAG